MKKILLILTAISIYSCIPLRIAPDIKEDKIMVAKKFKKKLPNSYSYIFEDRKDADEFYTYYNTKFNIESDVDGAIFNIDGTDFYLTFYESEIPTKTVNLVPIATDLVLKSKDVGPISAEHHITRNGKWFIVLTVSDIKSKDCLHPDFVLQPKIVSYLKALREEYLYTHNYETLKLLKK